MLALVVIVVVDVAASGSKSKSKTATSQAAPQSIVPSMTSRNEAFWHELTPQQKIELAQDCRSALISKASGSFGSDEDGTTVKEIGATTPTQIATQITGVYAKEEPESVFTIQSACANVVQSDARGREEKKQEKTGSEEEQKEQQNTNLIASVSNGTFEATDSNVRAYMKAALIGESVRSVTCSQSMCEVSFNDHNPVKLGILGKVLHVEGTPLSELTESVTKIFKALFSDRRLQQATVTSWIDVETVGGKLRKWPALRVMCERSAAEQIDWERVTPDGLKQLCDVSTLPDGSP